MARYAIHVKASVERDIAALPRDVLPRIFQSIEALSETPLPFGVRKLGRAEHLFRIRVGDYRIVYAVDHAVQEVIILYVRAATYVVGCDLGRAAPVLPLHREKSRVPVSIARRARGLPGSLTV